MVLPNTSFTFIFILSVLQIPELFFQSSRLNNVRLDEVPGPTFTIRTDDDSIVTVRKLKDENGIIYWHRRVDTPVCLTGTCKLIDVGLFWDCSGDFFGLEVYGENLTKTDHSEFRKEDYDKLLTILNDDWSMLREYEFSDLVTTGEEVDGVSGATRKELSEDAVEDAVYTTYTLWHLANLGEKEQLIDLTASELNKDKKLVDSLILSDQISHQYFLMDLLNSGKIKPYQGTDKLILKWLASDNAVAKSHAFRSLVFSDTNSQEIQSEVAGVYMKASLPEKVAMINAFKDAEISAPFYQALNLDRQIENPWFRKHLDEVLGTNDNHVSDDLR